MAEREGTDIVAVAVDFIASALTARLARSWNVVGLDITASKSMLPNATAARVVEEIRAGGGIAVPLKADVSDEKEVRSMFAAFVGAVSRIDILVATAAGRND